MYQRGVMHFATGGDPSDALPADLADDHNCHAAHHSTGFWDDLVVF